MAGYIGSKASVVSSGAERKKTFTITGATTSLTGLNYTVGKVHVFQNGVRLVDGTDYTATNGTTITLTAAAQNGDNVVVISQASFQVADALLTSGGTLTGGLTVQGTVAATSYTGDGSNLTGVGSPSIDDNGNATAMTIDSDEAVLIGMTTASTNNYGAGIRADGLIHAKRANVVATFNRASSDGDVVQISRDNTVVGSLGSRDGFLTIYNGDTGLGFDAGNDHIRPISSSGSRDNAIDLGRSSTRFKDAYLSGGVYLGGTGSANKLDDYEEGTWTPTLNSGSLNLSSATYTKVGRLVTLTLDASVATGGGSQIQNAPFTAGNTMAIGIFTSGQNFNSNRTAPTIVIGGGAGTMYFRDIGDNVSWLAMPLTTGASISFSFTYIAL
jgi:hypothetical protein